jgi:hypothetical protein
MQTEYVLTSEEQAELAVYLKAIAEVQQQMAPALRMIIRQQRLEGQWGLSQDGTKMLRQPDPIPLPTPDAIPAEAK